MAFVVRALRHWLGGRRVNVRSRSPASSKLSATARCLSRHLRMKALRRHSPNALKLAAANADDRHSDFIVKLRITLHLQQFNLTH